MPQKSTVPEQTDVSLSFTTYLRHYKFRLEEFLKYGLEEFDDNHNRCFTKPLLYQSKLKIQAEIEVVNLLLKSIMNYNNLHDNG